MQVGLERTESQNEESMCSDEDTSHVVNSQEVCADDAQTEDNMTTPPPTKIKKLSVSSKPKNVQKRTEGEDPRIGEAYAVLQTTLNKKKDEFDAYGEYIANVLRSMDRPTYAYVKKEFGEQFTKLKVACMPPLR